MYFPTLFILIEHSMFPSTVCDQGTILISGGFGGLGLTMSRWMIEERGVKRIVLMSRRTLSQLEQPQNPQYEDWLRLKQACLTSKNNAHVDVVQVDVTNFDDVYHLIEALNKTMYPVRGIIHSAVVSQDKVLANINKETLNLAMRAKVRGAWNLHCAAHQTGTPLHFFVMFSSIRNHLIDLGSAGYNAGNEYLDALARYRSKFMNLPSLSISLPAISGAGMFHRERAILDELYSNHGFESIPTLVAFEVIDRLFLNQKECPCPIIFACDWKVMGISHKKEQLATYQLIQLVQQQQTEQESFGNYIDKAQSHTLVETVDQIAERTQTTVARLLGATSIDRIDIERSLIAQGMDSLASVSLYNWLGQHFNIFVPLSDIIQGASIGMIAKQIFDKLAKQQDTVNTKIGASLTEKMFDETKIPADASNRPFYTGMNNVLKIIRSKTNSSSNHNIIFCIDALPPSLESKLVEQYASSMVYVLRIPSGSVAVTETIAQIRRIQPRGPYRLVSASKDGEYIAHEIVKQLKDQHKQVAAVYCSLQINGTTPADDKKKH